LALVKTIPIGYPNLAAFYDSDEDFMVYRQFGYLQNRILLDKQNEMANLEKRLDDLDQAEMCPHPDRLFRYNLEQSEVAHRRQLMAEIETKFCEYGTYIDDLLTLQNGCSHRRAQLPSSMQHLQWSGSANLHQMSIKASSIIYTTICEFMTVRSHTSITKKTSSP
jgi:hypothetical protein